MDVGCYCVNFARLVAGAEPTAIHAVGHVHDTGVDDLAAGTLTFPGGVVATFTCGMTVQADNTAHVCGTEGYIEIPVPWKPAVEGSRFTIVRQTPPLMDGNPRPPRRRGRRSKCPAGGTSTPTRPTTSPPPSSTAGRPPSAPPTRSATCACSTRSGGRSGCVLTG